ncbi:MAG: glycosyltransferase [Lacunisphaera sp.]|nr:glycosyltransferase [Lacunisphaera sp.]
MNENDAYIFDVEEPREWVFAGEPVWISGWFLSKAGAVFSDVRAVIDGLPHLGILGMPRPEIEQRHRGHTGLPHAGFLLRVNPPRSARELRLELLDAGHHWVEIWRTAIKVRQGGKRGGRYNLKLLPDHLHRLLQARRTDPAAELAPLADVLALEGAAVPLDTLPNPPFFGALEKPELVGGTQYGKVRVEGWIIHQKQRLVRLTGSTHPLVENDFVYGNLERPEAAQLFPGHPYAARSQYFGLLDIDENAPGPAVIKMFAELEDGTRHLVFARRFHARACHIWERPLPAFNWGEFLQCVLALLGAARRHRQQLGSVTAQWQALQAASALYRREAPAVVAPDDSRQDQYLAWLRTNRLTPRLRQALAGSAKNIAHGPRFTLLIDPAGCTDTHLRELALSLQAQIYPHWEAWFIGEKPPAGADARCKSERCAGLKDFARALNSAADQARGTHLTLLPGHSRLSPDALLEIAERIVARPELELVYTDEDLMDDSGAQSAPKFKPAWSPALALSGLSPGQLSFVRNDRFAAVGSFRDEYRLVPWADVLWRVGDKLAPDNVAQVPLVCHHARAEVSRHVEPSDPSVEQARKALTETMTRRDWAAAPFLPETAHHRRLSYHQLRWDQNILARLPVTIVIPTRDKLHLLQECVELLEETVDWRHAKLVIVDDHSRDADAVRYLEQIQKRDDLRCKVVRPADRGAPFNYSHLVNLALPHVDTPLVLHLNNDVNALERGWLEEMAGWFTQPDVGVVGAKLVYPDRTLNHTGIIIGPHGGLADTPYAKVAERDVPGVEWHAAAREVSAVTGACLMARTSVYRELGEFDEKDFGVAYNDVDFCLRVRAAGHRIIYTPQAQLMHWGSATRGVTFDEAEHIAFVRRYPAYRDPYLSPNLELAGGGLRCRGAGTVRPNRAGKLRLLLLTHNLNLEGAPLFLLEYATYMAHEAGFSLEVLSSQDGPLRAAYEALGAHITFIDAAPVYLAGDEEIFHGRVADIAHQVDWEHIDLVVCNTLASFWGVHLARRAGKPSLFYIHESTSIFRFFELKLKLELHHLVGEAFARATRALFLCEATQTYYEDHNLHGNFRLVSSWIQLDVMEEFRRAHTRTGLRRKHGFKDDEVVIANIGTVCERKGQHIFLRAIEHFNRQQGGGPPVRFVMVGARPGIYLDLLQRDIARLGLASVTFVPETREVFDFFLLADLFVCTSFEESFPRVVMEAMVFRTPMVTTDVHGIAEMIGQRQEGYLVKPGDVEGLSRMMRTCLAKERSGKSLTPAAYSKALRHYDSTKVLPHHAALAREAVLGHE